MRHFKLLLALVFVTIPFISSAKNDKIKVDKCVYDSIKAIADSIDSRLDSIDSLTIRTKIAEEKAIKSDRITQSYKERIEKIEKIDFNTTLEVCLTFPLAVKLHKEGVNATLQVAESIYNSGVVTDSAYIEFYDKYVKLLRNYEKYNNEVINYIKEHRDLIKNGVKKESVLDLAKTLNPSLTEYKNIYDKDYSISYLDKVIKKYLNELESYVRRNQNIDPRFFDAFIRNNLSE